MTEEPVPAGRVVTVNAPELNPAGMTTVAGTVALAVLELVNITLAPPVGAGPLRVAVAVGFCPWGTLVRSRVTENAWRDGATVCVAALEVPPDAAVTLTFLFLVTANVEIANVAVDSPAGTVMLAGTVATEVFELVSVTSVPPGGAAPSSVTVPVEVADPNTVDGASVTVAGTGTADVVRLAVLFVPAFEAVMVVAPVVAVGNVGIANVMLVAPDGTVTLAGTVARATTELASVTIVPPEGAGAVRVTVPVTDIPPTALAGATDTVERLATDAGAAKRRTVRKAPKRTDLEARFMWTSFLLL